MASATVIPSIDDQIAAIAWVMVEFRPGHANKGWTAREITEDELSKRVSLSLVALNAAFENNELRRLVPKLYPQFVETFRRTAKLGATTSKPYEIQFAQPLISGRRGAVVAEEKLDSTDLASSLNTAYATATSSLEQGKRSRDEAEPEDEVPASKYPLPDLENIASLANSESQQQASTVVEGESQVEFMELEHSWVAQEENLSQG